MKSTRRELLRELLWGFLAGASTAAIADRALVWPTGRAPVPFALAFHEMAFSMVWPAIRPKVLRIGICEPMSVCAGEADWYISGWTFGGAGLGYTQRELQAISHAYYRGLSDEPPLVSDGSLESYRRIRAATVAGLARASRPMAGDPHAADLRVEPGEIRVPHSPAGPAVARYVASAAPERLQTRTRLSWDGHRVVLLGRAGYDAPPAAPALPD